MPLTVLQMAQRLAPRAGLGSPTSLVGVSGQTEELILASMRAAMDDLLEDQHNWVDLTLEHTFTTTSGVQEYDLPADFHRFAPATVWDRANYRNMRAGLTAADWQVIKSSLLANNPDYRRWRIRLNASNVKKFELVDAETVTGDELVFEYVSAYWAADTGGTRKADITQDDDTFILPDSLIMLETLWRLRGDEGFSHESHREEARDLRARIKARDTGPSANVDPTAERQFEQQFLSYFNIPETGYG